VPKGQVSSGVYRHEDRGAEGAERGRVWGGGCPLSPDILSIFELKKTRFDAFWAVMGK